MVVTIIAARSLAPSHFGLFSLAFVIYVAVTGITRSAVLEATLVRNDPGVDSDRAVTGSVGIVSLAWAAAIALIGLLAGGDIRSVLVALAICLIPLLMVDAGRMLSFSHRLPARALGIDATWALLAVVATIQVSGRSSPTTFVLAWGLSSTPSALLTLKWTGLPSPRRTWVQRSWPLGWRYTLEWFAGAGSAHLATIGLGAVTGIAGLAGLRGAQILFGPLNVLYSGVGAVLIPEGRAMAAPRLARLVALSSAGMTALAFTCTGLFLLMPNSLGKSVLGDTWANAQGLILPVGCAVAAGGVMSGPILGMRARRAARSSLRVRLAFAPIQVAIPLACAVPWGETGFAWGLAGATAAAAATWWILFERSNRNGVEELDRLLL
jgi:O-antigen/teichoic acid export membrane protein